MTRRSGHLEDAELIGRYFGDEDASVEHHLGRCHACAARRDTLQSMLDADRDRCATGAEAYFTPARLDAQRSAVLGRLGERPRRARVLSFPLAARPHDSESRMPPWGLRWAAAVATAAMVAVAGAGWLGEESRRTGGSGTDASWAVDPASLAGEPDDAALTAIDVALARPGAAELRALDALTLQAVPAVDRR